MQRVVILGCSGGGKSMLARRLGETLGLPVIHLDALYWTPGWVAREAEDFQRLVGDAVAGDRWVTDGNYAPLTFPLRLPRADTLLWVDQPRWLCMARVLLRAARHFGRSRSDMPAGCPERFDWAFTQYVWSWKRKQTPAYLRRLAELAPHLTIRWLRSDREIAALLAEAAGPSSTRGEGL